MAKVAQCDNMRYFIGVTEDYGQGCPSNCFPTIPAKIDRDKEDNDPDGWYNGYHPRMNEAWTEWEYLKSYKGIDGYKGIEKVTIDTHYLPDGVTLDPVYTKATKQAEFNRILAEKITQINIVRDAMLIAGVLYKGILFDSRTSEREDILRLLEYVKLNGWTFGDSYKRRAKNNAMIPFTLQDVQTLYSIYVLQSNFIHDTSFADKDKVRNFQLKNVEKLKAFTPMVYTVEEINEQINLQLTTKNKA